MGNRRIYPLDNHLSEEQRMKARGWFTEAARATARYSGHPLAFSIAFGVVLVWAITGPLFRYSDTWQLVINTGTTIVTFLMVFLIQHTQNRDTVAIHIKLDELIRAMHSAHNAVVSLEDLDDLELDKLRKQYDAIAAEARRRVQDGRKDTGSPPVDCKEIPQQKE
jgi:low affinity Fe/Cu permease